MNTDKAGTPNNYLKAIRLINIEENKCAFEIGKILFVSILMPIIFCPN